MKEIVLGRPTKYNPEMCQTVIEEMSQGASKCEVAAALGICEDTLYTWLKDPEKKIFSEAIRIGSSLSKAWWLKKGRVNLDTKEFNSTCWYMNMKNRHGWTDKQEHKVDAQVSYIQLLDDISEKENGGEDD